MIKYNELRIGNLIQTSTDSPLTVVVTSDILSAIDRGHELYSGIPLSEEWLLKFGFEGTKDSGGTYYAFQRHRVYLLNDGFEFEISTSEFSRANLFRTYKCVHQLQNLYFAITGEELTITV